MIVCYWRRLLWLLLLRQRRRLRLTLLRQLLLGRLRGQDFGRLTFADCDLDFRERRQTSGTTKDGAGLLSLRVCDAFKALSVVECVTSISSPDATVARIKWNARASTNANPAAGRVGRESQFTLRRRRRGNDVAVTGSFQVGMRCENFIRRCVGLLDAVDPLPLGSEGAAHHRRSDKVARGKSWAPSRVIAIASFSKRFILRHELPGRIEASFEPVVVSTPFRQVDTATTTEFAIHDAIAATITATAAAAEARRVIVALRRPTVAGHELTTRWPLVVTVV